MHFLGILSLIFVIIDDHQFLDVLHGACLVSILGVSVLRAVRLRWNNRLVVEERRGLVLITESDLGFFAALAMIIFIIFDVILIISCCCYRRYLRYCFVSYLC